MLSTTLNAYAQLQFNALRERTQHHHRSIYMLRLSEGHFEKKLNLRLYCIK